MLGLVKPGLVSSHREPPLLGPVLKLGALEPIQTIKHISILRRLIVVCVLVTVRTLIKRVYREDVGSIPPITEIKRILLRAQYYMR